MANKHKLFWIFALSASVYFVQGIEGLPSQALFYYLKETLGLSPQKIMLLTSLTTAAWLVKPVIGYAIDNFFNKKVWIFSAITLDLIFVTIMGYAQMPVWMLVVFLLATSTNAAFRDVAVDGIMCVEGKKYGITGKIQSVQWIAFSFSGLLTGIGGGIIAEKWGYQAGFLCLLPFYLLVALAAHAYKETDRSAGEISPPKELFAHLKELFSNKRLMVVGSFIFLYKYSPSFGTPLFFIQRDAFGWGKVWIGALGTLGILFGIAGSLLYYRFSQKINITKWLFISVFLGAALSLSYLYYTPVTAVIYDTIYSLLGMFIFLMVMDFMARNTVPGLEATSFALLCSFSNLALVTSNLSGALLLPVVGLKWLIVLSSATSFLCLPLIGKIRKNSP